MDRHHSFFGAPSISVSALSFSRYCFACSSSVTILTDTSIRAMCPPCRSATVGCRPIRPCRRTNDVADGVSRQMDHGLARRCLGLLLVCLMLLGCADSPSEPPAARSLELTAVTAILQSAGIVVDHVADNLSPRDGAWACLPGSFRLARISQQPPAALAQPGDRPSVEVLLFSNDADRATAQRLIGADGQQLLEARGEDFRSALTLSPLTHEPECVILRLVHLKMCDIFAQPMGGTKSVAGITNCNYSFWRGDGGATTR